MCESCQWREYKALTEDLANRGSRFALNLLDNWFDHAEHVTSVQKVALDHVREKFGLATPRCRYCHRTLTDPESIARGIGPVCWARQEGHP